MADAPDTTEITAPIRKTRGRYAPLNPVCQGTDFRCPGEALESTVGSLIVGSNADLMKAVCALWVAPGETVLDVTFGKGGFWKSDGAPPVVAHDINGDGVDFRSLPEQLGSQAVVAFDPPYRPTHGGSPTDDHADRYGVGGPALDTINDVIALYRAGLEEAFRVLGANGRVLVKCQDMSYDHRLHLVSLDVMREMIAVGFDIADQFILGASSGARRGRQERANRRHSVLWVGIRP